MSPDNTTTRHRADSGTPFVMRLERRLQTSRRYNANMQDIQEISIRTILILGFFATILLVSLACDLMMTGLVSLRKRFPSRSKKHWTLWLSGCVATIFMFGAGIGWAVWAHLAATFRTMKP